jgi:hypothetical protein
VLPRARGASNAASSASSSFTTSAASRGRPTTTGSRGLPAALRADAVTALCIRRDGIRLHEGARWAVVDGFGDRSNPDPEALEVRPELPPIAPSESSAKARRSASASRSSSAASSALSCSTPEPMDFHGSKNHGLVLGLRHTAWLILFNPKKSTVYWWLGLCGRAGWGRDGPLFSSSKM